MVVGWEGSGQPELGGHRAQSLLVAELFIDILIHERGLSHTGIAQDDNLQKSFLSRRHGWNGIKRLPILLQNTVR